jgi:hypothetical protein
MINVVFMLTQNDAMVPNALEVLEELRGSGLRYVGLRDAGVGVEQLAEAADAAHDQGFEVMLEVVSTSEEEELRSLEAAVSIGAGWVLGGTRPEVGTEILGGAEVRYCPLPGAVVGHPGVHAGTVEGIAAETHRLTRTPGIDGIHLLAYRHPTADVGELARAVVAASAGPVIATGSVVGLDQIRLLEHAGAWGFTIGSPIFEGRLPGAPEVAAQVRAVLDASAPSGSPAEVL